MSLELQAFDASIARCRALVSSSDYLRSVAKGLEETADDILRAGLAQAVSALDRFVHERVRTGMLECAQGVRPRTSTFKRFTVPLANALAAAEASPADVTATEAWLNPAISEQHGRLSFQRSEKVADAIRLVRVREQGGLWEYVSHTLEADSVKDVKTRLDLIIDRRNQIVHEDDAETGSRRAEIDEPLVTQAIDFLAAVVTTIDAYVEAESSAEHERFLST